MADDLTLDELETRTLALRELLAQMRRIEAAVPPDQARIDALTGDEAGPAAYDLTAIWLASLDDPGCVHIGSRRGVSTARSRRYFSPRRYLGGWGHLVTPIVDAGDGRILVDREAAIQYCQMADARVFRATVGLMEAQRKEAARRNAIAAAVASAKGGGLALMNARLDAREILGLTDEEFDSAVFARARTDAATMGDHAAEPLLSEVRQALEDGTRLGPVDLDD